MAKSYKKLNKIKTKIKNDNQSKIEWLEIEKNGNKYIVKVIERVLTSKDNENVPKDVIAKRNGFIIDLYVKQGEIIKNKGDYVNKGDVIVSGLIKKNDNIVNVLTADAKAYAEVWYKVTVSSQINYQTKVNSKQNKNILDIIIFGKKFKILSYKSKIKKEKSKSLFKSANMEIVLTSNNIKEETTKNYKEKELQLILENLAYLKIKNNLLENEKILSQKTLKNTLTNDRMEIEVFFKVYEDVATQIDINMG